jgi:hypothetical protein
MADSRGRNDFWVQSPSSMLAFDSTDSPSLNPNLPCGPVFPNIWFFSAPISLLKPVMPYMLGARLEFALMSPSHEGEPRSEQDTVVLRAAGGKTLTYTSSFGRPGPDWTYHTVLLDEGGGERTCWLRFSSAGSAVIHTC